MATRFIVQRDGDISHFIKDFATVEEAQRFIDNYLTRDVLVINECEFDEEDGCFDLPLSEKEFDTLVDLMLDNGMDFELTPADSPNDSVVLKFKNGSFFRCLLKDYERAIDYINDPSLGEGF